MKNTNRSRVLLLATTLLISYSTAACAEPEKATQFRLDAKIVSSAEDKALLDVTGGGFQVIEDDDLVKMLTEKDVDLLSAPSIIALAGQEATISIQTELQYFERDGEDTFVLKKLPEEKSPGVRLTAAMKPADNGNVGIDIDLWLNTMKDRKRIPGLTLDVGSPIMQSQNIKTQIVVPPAQWAAIESLQLQDGDSGKREHLMILVRVTQQVAQ
jgi:hypothetical protein